MVLLSVGHSDIFMGSLNEVLPKFIFEFRGSSISLNGFEVFVEFELVELLLLELFKGFLDGKFGSVVEELLIFFILGSFHRVTVIISIIDINENTHQRVT